MSFGQVQSLSVVFTSLVLMLALGASECHAQSTPLVLAKSGKAGAAIVIPYQADPIIQESAAQLKHYLDKSTGSSFPLMQDGDNQVSLYTTQIHVGMTDYVTSLNLDLDSVGLEGYLLKTTDEHLVIVGQDVFGTSYGVYGFLEAYLGVRWFMPGDLFQIVPRHTELALGPIDERVRPDFVFRGFSGVRGDEGITWRRRNGLTRKEGMARTYAFHHNMHAILPVSRYADHPEYYALINGKRMVPNSDADHWWQPCLTELNVIGAAVDAARAFFDAHPEARALSLGANDNGMFCQCTRCASLTRLDRTFRSAKYPEAAKREMYSDLFFPFVNEVARQVRQTHPDKLIGASAYLWTELPPVQITKFEPNVVIFITQDNSQYYDEEYHQFDSDVLNDWLSRVEHVGVYTYDGLSYSVPRYYPHMSAGHIKAVHDRGADGFYDEIYPYWPYVGPQPYMTTKLLWDSSLNPDDLLDEFFTGLFGPAAQPMRAFYDTLEAAWMAQPGQGLFFRYKSNIPLQARILSPQIIDDLKQQLQDALAAAGEDHAVRQRIKYIRRGMIYCFALKPLSGLMRQLDDIDPADSHVEHRLQATAARLRDPVILSQLRQAHQRTMDQQTMAPSTFDSIPVSLNYMPKQIEKAIDRKVQQIAP